MCKVKKGVARLLSVCVRGVRGEVAGREVMLLLWKRLEKNTVARCIGKRANFERRKLLNCKVKSGKR